ncbi:hypothetical protein GGF43_002291 [Coemansia sp. RSA 2618]|nr:hypothetical protein GGF43_002291 [Coemansia sp. RSA 2618]
MSSGEEDEDEEVEDFDPKRRHPDATYKADESSDDDEPSHGVEHPVRRGPGRPRKQAHEGPATPARRSWEVRRIPVHLTKHDAFRAESLDACAHILNAIPVEELSSGERYEQMKMSDALKMCGYELGASTSGTEPVQEVYRLLSWAVHAAGPNGAVHEAPVLSDAGRTVLLRVFAAMGSRIREETRDMAGYHRRHALRKLILAESEAPAADEDDAPVSPRGAAHRRNPLRIPGPLIDIWKEPYKKSADARNSAEHESQASDA